MTVCGCYPWSRNILYQFWLTGRDRTLDLQSYGVHTPFDLFWIFLGGGSLVRNPVGTSITRPLIMLWKTYCPYLVLFSQSWCGHCGHDISHASGTLSQREMDQSLWRRSWMDLRQPTRGRDLQQRNDLPRSRHCAANKIAEIYGKYDKIWKYVTVYITTVWICVVIHDNEYWCILIIMYSYSISIGCVARGLFDVEMTLFEVGSGLIAFF